MGGMKKPSDTENALAWARGRRLDARGRTDPEPYVQTLVAEIERLREKLKIPKVKNDKELITRVSMELFKAWRQEPDFDYMAKAAIREIGKSDSIR